MLLFSFLVILSLPFYFDEDRSVGISGECVTFLSSVYFFRFFLNKDDFPASSLQPSSTSISKKASPTHSISYHPSSPRRSCLFKGIRSGSSRIKQRRLTACWHMHKVSDDRNSPLGSCVLRFLSYDFADSTSEASPSIPQDAGRDGRP